MKLKTFLSSDVEVRKNISSVPRVNKVTSNPCASDQPSPETSYHRDHNHHRDFRDPPSSAQSSWFHPRLTSSADAIKTTTPRSHPAPKHHTNLPLILSSFHPRNPHHLTSLHPTQPISLFKMCNTHEKRFKTCGCVMRQITTHYWDLCDRARKAWTGGETYELSKCSFGVFSEGYHDIEGRCSSAYPLSPFLFQFVCGARGEGRGEGCTCAMLTGICRVCCEVGSEC